MKQQIIHSFRREFLDHIQYPDSLALAFVYIALLVSQLFTFEDFPSVVSLLGLPGGEVTKWLFVIGIPLVELLSLPYLLMMKANRKLLNVSRVAVIAVGAAWVVMSLWLAVTATNTNSGLFGATIPVPAGVFAVLYSALLFASAIAIVHECRPQAK